MKKTLFTLFTAISFALLYCPAALALTEDEAAAAVGARMPYPAICSCGCCALSLF